MRALTRNALVAVAVIAAMMAAPAAYAERHGGPGHHGEGGPGGRGEFQRDLDLTPEQRDALKAHREETRARRQELQTALKDLRADLKDELQKPELNTDRVNALTADIKALTNKMIDARVDSIVSLKKILTPEQFEKMHQKMHRHQEKRKAKMQHRW